MQYRPMNHSPTPIYHRLPVTQSLLILTGLMLLSTIPPARGNMVAVPLLASQRAAGMAGMIHTGARVVRAGPIIGSLVLHADRNAITSIALLHGILLLPTTLTGCESGGRPT